MLDRLQCYTDVLVSSVMATVTVILDRYKKNTFFDAKSAMCAKFSVRRVQL